MGRVSVELVQGKSNVTRVQLFSSKKTMHGLQYVPMCWLPHVYVCSHFKSSPLLPLYLVEEMMHCLVSGVVGEINLHVVHNVRHKWA